MSDNIFWGNQQLDKIIKDFTIICSQKQLPDVLYKVKQLSAYNFNYIKFNINNILCDCCTTCQDISILEWMQDTFIFLNLSHENNLPFKNACKYGNIKVIEWLIKQSDDINIDMENGLVYKCAVLSNDFDLLQWIINLELISIYTILTYTCQQGNLKIIEWLLTDINKHCNIDISFKNNLLIRTACYLNHIHIAQYLIQNFPGKINIRDYNDDVFYHFCKYGKLEYLDWLLSEYPGINIEAYDNYAFRLAAVNNQPVILEWFRGKGVDIKHIINAELFELFCTNHLIQTVKYLIYMFPEKYEALFQKNQIIYFKTIREYAASPISIENCGECAICLDNTNNVITDCKHAFCKSCIDKYTGSTCPLCRNNNVQFFI